MNDTTKQRITAIIRLVIPCVVSIAALYGVEIDADALIQVALTALAAITWVCAWWKDNNITSKAIQRHITGDKETNEQTTETE